MTWNLEVDIDLAGEPFELVKALIECFANDLRNIRFEVARGLVFDEKILAKENLIWQSDTLSQLHSLFQQQWATDISIVIGLGLHGYGDFDYNPYPEIVFYGSQHLMRTEYAYSSRRTSEATIDDD